MSKQLIFDLMSLINSAKGEPDAIVDEVWAAGYRKPERSAEEAAQLTIDTFFECNQWDIPARFWPETYTSVLQNELMKVAMGEDFDLDTRQVAERIIAAGYIKVVADDAA